MDSSTDASLYYCVKRSSTINAKKQCFIQQACGGDFSDKEAMFSSLQATKQIPHDPALCSVQLFHNQQIVLHHPLTNSGKFRRQMPFAIHQELDFVPSRSKQQRG